MSMTDPIADLLTRIRNAQMAGRESLEVPYSRVKGEIVEILRGEGYIFGHKLNQKSPCSTLTILLKYGEDRQPAIRKLERISKPGCRRYVGKLEIPQVLAGLGISILSTSRGIMTGKKAEKAGVGGEILIEVY